MEQRGEAGQTPPSINQWERSANRGEKVGDNDKKLLTKDMLVCYTRSIKITGESQKARSYEDNEGNP